VVVKGGAIDVVYGVEDGVMVRVLAGGLGCGCRLLGGDLVVVVAVYARMASELVGATEALLAEGEGAHKRLFACVGPDMARLRVLPVR
jgi:hypothetical protein